MAKYAKGRHALGISDRSGFRYPLNKMRKEWNGSMVGPDEYEPKHPQLTPKKIGGDAIALKNPRPDPDKGHVYVATGYGIQPEPANLLQKIVTRVGEVEVTTS